MKFPQKISIANSFTPILDLDILNPDKAWTKLYIKRDDFTGFETSGNKIRKLEYHIKKVLDQNSDVLITCGGFQSNHARAVASVAAQFSLDCYLVLRKSDEPDLSPDSNYLFDELFGANINLITEQQYNDIETRTRIMEDVANQFRLKGKNPYILPEGGSNGIGVFGYFDAYMEILKQEQALGLTFDAICVADGSGGTYAGLYMADKLLGGGKNIIGFNIYGPKPTTKHIKDLLQEGSEVAGLCCTISTDYIHINSDYLGDGYGAVSKELVLFIRDTARKTGIILDPVYTGKALMGTVGEIRKKNPLLKGNVLFIHTGGQFGIFPYKELFQKA